MANINETVKTDSRGAYVAVCNPDGTNIATAAAASIDTSAAVTKVEQRSSGMCVLSGCEQQSVMMTWVTAPPDTFTINVGSAGAGAGATANINFAGNTAAILLAAIVAKDNTLAGKLVITGGPWPDAPYLFTYIDDEAYTPNPLLVVTPHENGGTTTTTVASQIKTGSGYLHGVTVLSSVAQAVTLYDNTWASGKVIATLPASLAVGDYLMPGVTFGQGLAVSVAGGGANSLLFHYR